MQRSIERKQAGKIHRKMTDQILAQEENLGIGLLG